MRKLRSFLMTSGDGRHWLVEETWCEDCGEADLGIDEPVESEERGARRISGRCAACGAAVRREVRGIEFDPRPAKISAPRPKRGRDRPRRRAARKARRRGGRRSP